MTHKSLFGNPNRIQRNVVADDELETIFQDSVRLESFDELAVAAQDSQTDDFWPMLASMADRCDGFIERNGYPFGIAMVQHDGNGNWQSPDRSSTESPVTLQMAYLFTLDHAADFSKLWFAAQIALDIREAQELRKRDAADFHILWKVFGIGRYVQSHCFREAHKRDALRGKKTGKNLRETREAENERKKTGVENRRTSIEIFLAETQLSGGALEKYLTKRLNAQGTGISARTLRRDLAAIRNA